MNAQVEEELQLVLGRERELQSKVCRDNPARVRELLALDFSEVGASGHMWDLPSTLALLESQSDDDAGEIEVVGLVGRVLADNLILVQWDSDHRGRRARRTSLWRRDEDGCRQVHHQVTVLEQ